MKRRIEVVIEDEGPLVQPGCARIAVTEQGDDYRLHSLARVHVAPYLSQKGLGWVVGGQVSDFLNGERK